MASKPSLANIHYQKAHISESRVGSIIAANVICYTIGCLAVVLRFVSRRLSNIKYEWDDWLVVAGLFFTLGIFIADLLGIQWGSGRHAILMKNGPAFAKNLIAEEVIYNFAITAIKGSLLYLYYRVFFVSRYFRYSLWAVGLFVAAYSITQVFAAIFQFGATIIAAFNVLTDFIILALPMPLLYKLQKPFHQKLQIMGMFLLGGFVCFASIYRAVVIHRLSHSDPTWSDVPVNIWTMVELNIGILSACLPTYRPLFTRRGRNGSRKTDSSANANGSGSSRSDQNPSDQSLRLQKERSIPSHSKNWSHLGVLGDDVQKQEEVRVHEWEKV